MATVRLKDLAKTATSMASDDYLGVDGATNGTRKMTSGSLKSDLAAAFSGAPTTYKLAPLNASNKIPTGYLPAGSETYQGTWDANGNVPALADGVGSAGDVYDVTVAGTRDLGSGSQVFNLGDQVKYDGAVWNLIPGTSNVLNGSATEQAARDVLEVESITEIGEALALKLNRAAMAFDGASQFVQIADDAKLSFAPLKPFSISAWVYMEDATSFPIIAKASTGSLREWRLGTNASDKLIVALRDNGVVTEATRISDSAITSLQKQWIHVAMTYSGDSAATACADDVTLYINGVEIASTPTNSGTHTGMVDTSDPVYIGRFASDYAFGKIAKVTLFNRELSAGEVADDRRYGLVDIDEWGGEAEGTTYTSDFSAGADSWTAANGTVAGNIDTIGGQDDNLRLTIDATTSTHSALRTVSMTNGKKYRISFDYYIPSSNSHVDGIQLSTSQTGAALFQDQGAVLDAWNSMTVDTTIDESTAVQVVALDGSTGTITDPGGDDVLYIRNFKITQVGKVGEWDANNMVDGVLLDASSNALHGTNNGAVVANQAKALEIDTNAAAAGNKVVNIHDGSSSLASIDDKGDATVNSIAGGAATELTIATGVVTATKTVHTVDTESDAASDDLDTINGGRAGQLLILRAADSARTVVVKDGTGNLNLGGDFSLDNAEDTITLVSDGTDWYEIARSDNGA